MKSPCEGSFPIQAAGDKSGGTGLAELTVELSNGLIRAEQMLQSMVSGTSTRRNLPGCRNTFEKASDVKSSDVSS